MKPVCIVTGGSSGIGQSIVQTFLANDYLVFNLDLTESSYGEFCHCDIRDHQAVTIVINGICAQHKVDVLVTSAGIHFSGNIENTTEQELDNVIAINVKGLYSAVKHS